jgi:hypothetical protein
MGEMKGESFSMGRTLMGSVRDFHSGLRLSLHDPDGCASRAHLEDFIGIPKKPYPATLDAPQRGG